MKIRSVEIPLEDETDSTGSDTLLDMQNPSLTTAEQYEKTIATFAAAMTELHADLRDKTTECEALYETAHNLSNALQESDSMLQEKTLECERLQLKLQMVTFAEPTDDPPLSFLEEQYYEERESSLDEEEDFAIPRRPAAILDHLPAKHGGTKKNSIGKPKPENKIVTKGKKKNKPDFTTERVDVDFLEELATKDYATSIVNARTVSAPSAPKFAEKKSAGPVCVDDVNEIGELSGEAIKEKEEAAAAFFAGPRQAHFYHIILERDMAVQTAKKLTRELKFSRSKVRELKSKLDRSTTLVELSYKDGKQQEPRKQNQEPRKQLQLPRKPLPNLAAKTDQRKPAAKTDKAGDGELEQIASVRQRSGLHWLRKHGMSVRNHSSECIKFISEDEMMNTKWNSTDDKAASAFSEQEYIKAMLSSNSDDADRAGGHRPALVNI